ncbi:hypothetical protein FACS1894172_19360 [Spirochaetia bacterium]|nr:hypothetical protein FACS1894172_19360 [Spirochaetia bacterium]
MGIKFIFIIILFSLFCLVGAIVFVYNIYTSNKFNKWELTNGIIINTFISEEMVENIDNGGKTKMYKANIEYEYIVNGKKYYYNNNKFNYKTFYGKKNMVQKYLKNYDVGKNIDIKYDKNNPRNSIMKNQIYEMKLFMNIFSLFFLFIGIIGLIVIIKYGVRRHCT